MEKLTKSLAETLDAIKPFEGDEAFMKELVEQRSPLPGYTPSRLLGDIAELEQHGMLKVFVYHKVPNCFDLTSSGRDYRRNRALDVAKAIGRYAFQLLVGASGGLVVLVVGRLLGQ